MACHVTFADAGELVPSPLVAVTEYVAGPAAVPVNWQVEPLLLQPVQLYELGDCVQFAVSVSVPPTYGVVVLGVSVQTGGAVGGDCQVTETSPGVPNPFALAAVTR